MSSRGLRCAVVTSVRGKEETDHSHQAAQTGSDVGVVAIRDVYLLAHSSVLIAGFGGTFAALISELMAHRSVELSDHLDVASGAAEPAKVLRSSPLPTIRLCDEPAQTGICGPELPLVSRAWWHLSLSFWPRAELIEQPPVCTNTALTRPAPQLINPVEARPQQLPKAPTTSPLDQPPPNRWRLLPLRLNESYQSIGLAQGTGSGQDVLRVVLHRRGERPAWDDYLESVYAGPVSYPFDLGRLTWFYWNAPVGALKVTCGSDHAMVGNRLMSGRFSNT